MDWVCHSNGKTYSVIATEQKITIQNYGEFTLNGSTKEFQNTKNQKLKLYKSDMGLELIEVTNKKEKSIEEGYYYPKSYIGLIFWTILPEKKCTSTKCAQDLKNQKKYCSQCCSNGCCTDCWKGKKRPCIVMSKINDVFVVLGYNRVKRKIYD